MIVEILGIILGSSIVGNIVSYFLYKDSNKRFKQAETNIKEAEAQLKKIETEAAKDNNEHKAKSQLYEIIAEMNSQMKDVVVSSGDQIDILNKHLLEEIDRRQETTERLRKFQDELLESKNEIIKLTSEKADLTTKLNHYKNWVCHREYSDCQRREPEQKIKCHYTPIDE